MTKLSARSHDERNESLAGRNDAPAVRDEDVAGGRLLLGWIFVLVGVVLLVVGWFGVSGHAIVAVQLPYFVSGGIGGLFCGIVGVGLLVSDDVRRDRARIGRLEAAVLEMREMIAAQSSLLLQQEFEGRDQPNDQTQRKAK